MRKVVWSMYVSLDGVVEEPGWTSAYWNDEIVNSNTMSCFPATPSF